jgi:hypothetical protein
MEDAGAVAPRERGWRKLILALLAFLLVPFVPLLRVVAPVEQTLALVVAMVAACTVAGWRIGGRFSTMAIWVLVATWFVTAPRMILVAGSDPHWVTTPATAYDWLWRGWTALLGGSFGLVLIAVRRSSFLPRALAALAIAIGSGFVVATAIPNGFARISRAMLAEFNRRNDESLAALNAMSTTQGWQDLLKDSPRLEQVTRDSEEQLRVMPQYTSPLVPALVALEALVALALGWSIYHRLARVRLGPPFDPLREFRFNDQLVWGVALGATLFLLTQFEEGRVAGLNLLLFFGALYAVRGFGVLLWMTRGRLAMAALVFATTFALPLVGAMAVAMGLGDTWLDWRKRLRPAS